jgi:hypothetical protein
MPTSPYMELQSSARRMPVELIAKILACLDHSDLASVSCTSRWFNDLAEHIATIQRRALLEDLRYDCCNCARCLAIPAIKTLAMMEHHGLMWTECRFLTSRTRLQIIAPSFGSPISRYRRHFTQGVYILHSWRDGDGDDSHSLHLYEVDSAANRDRNIMPDTLGLHERNSSSLVCSRSLKCNSFIRGLAVDRFGHDLIVLATMEHEDVYVYLSK